MRFAKPPALATWLIEHLVPGEKNEALTGDLLEQFSYGRSAAWYWRQVLVAILVGLSKELRSQWRPIGFAILWTGIISTLDRHISTVPAFRSFPHWIIGFGWFFTTASLLTFFLLLNAAEFLAAVSLYLWVTRSFEFRELLRGVLTGLVVIVSSDILIAFMQLPRQAGNPTIQTMFYLQFYRGVAFPAPVFYVIGYGRFFFAVLAAMLVARPDAAGNKTSRISA